MVTLAQVLRLRRHGQWIKDHEGKLRMELQLLIEIRDKVVKGQKKMYPQMVTAHDLCSDAVEAGMLPYFDRNALAACMQSFCPWDVSRYEDVNVLVVFWGLVLVNGQDYDSLGCLAWTTIHWAADFTSVWAATANVVCGYDALFLIIFRQWLSTVDSINLFFLCQ